MKKLNKTIITIALYFLFQVDTFAFYGEDILHKSVEWANSHIVSPASNFVKKHISDRVLNKFYKDTDWYSKYTPHIDMSWVKCDFVLHKKAFNICYSCKEKHPVSVSYVVDGNKIDAKNLKRDHLTFRPDYQLPAKCRSYPKDYSGTGYDRGHMAPNAAFDYDRRIQKETFLMSNIAPQKPYLNRKKWVGIERFVRIQARKYGQVEVVTGSCGHIENIKNGVGVPEWWYKIIYIPEGRTIAFLAPNTNKIKRQKVKDLLSTVEKIKERCGYIQK